MIDMDYYELLEVERGADDKVLKSAYRRLAVQYHPDKNPGDKQSEDRFKAISEAYDCLKDPQKRAAYDRFGKAAFQNGGGAGGGFSSDDLGGFSDIFENIFGDFMGRQRGGQQRQNGGQRGNDLRYDLEMTFEEAFTGKDSELVLDVSTVCTHCSGKGAKPGTSAKTCHGCNGRGQVRMSQGLFVVERPCPTCRGAGQIIPDPCGPCHGQGRVEQRKTLNVKVPAGVDDGTRIRVSGEGEAGMRGGPTGDLYLFVNLKPHPIFKREGTTLFAAVPVSLTTVALGGEIEVLCLDRNTCPVRIPAGTQSGKQFRVRGRGFPALNGGGTGDLVIQVDVETPTKLSARQRELLEEFQTLEAEAGSCPKSTGFFAKLKEAWDAVTE